MRPVRRGLPRAQSVRSRCRSSLTSVKLDRGKRTLNVLPFGVRSVRDHPEWGGRTAPCRCEADGAGQARKGSLRDRDAPPCHRCPIEIEERYKVAQMVIRSRSRSVDMDEVRRRLRMS
ncbi:MAG: hypothetical protein MZV70_43755 [Desulfobacterales bacterium]|nr:hypothetical protein [Desulfobacterales bacterium]